MSPPSQTKHVSTSPEALCDLFDEAPESLDDFMVI